MDHMSRLCQSRRNLKTRRTTVRAIFRSLLALKEQSHFCSGFCVERHHSSYIFCSVCPYLLNIEFKPCCFSSNVITYMGCAFPRQSSMNWQTTTPGIDRMVSGAHRIRWIHTFCIMKIQLCFS